METPDREGAKMELMVKTSELMPGGSPDFLTVVKYPMIKDVVKIQGHKPTLAVLSIMVKDFSASINVVRNLNEDQVIEIAGMLLDECDNFRLEDYVMMFSLAKRGKLVKIFDRLDISVVTEMLDNYWKQRHEQGIKHQEKEVEKFENFGFVQRERANPSDVKISESMNGLAGAIGELKDRYKQWSEEK